MNELTLPLCLEDSMRKVLDLQTAAQKIAGRIDAGQFQTAERLMSELGSVGEPIISVLAAEVETYFARLENAEQLLKDVRGNLDQIDLARFAMAQGSLCYWKFEYEQAEENFQAASHLYKFLLDSFQVANALYNMGRLRRRQSRFDEAQSYLSQARDLLASEPPEMIERFEFLSGLIDLNDAICKHQLGDLDAAGGLYASSIELLRRSEECRYYGNALNSYGIHLSRFGRYEEAINSLNQAVIIFDSLGTFDELGAAHNNLALSMIRTKRFDEAKRLPRDTIDLHQRTGNISFATISLQLFAEIYLETGELERAESFVTQAIEQADLSGNPFDQADAFITAGRIAYRRGDSFKAERLLNIAVDLANKIASKQLMAASMIFLAECCLTTSVVKGREYLLQATNWVREFPDKWFETELERVSERYRGDRIAITDDNKLQVNGNLLPSWNAAKEALERFLIKNALELADGNQTKAGQLLGITKVHVHDKRRQYDL